MSKTTTRFKSRDQEIASLILRDKFEQCNSRSKHYEVQNIDRVIKPTTNQPNCNCNK